MLNARQHEQLLKPINPNRVAKRSHAGRSLSYLEAWDVKAHLIRIFGFGGWSWDVLEASIAYEDQNEKGQWQVGYRVVGRLTIHDLACTYTEAAVGSATLPSRGDAHDMAIKTAESDALKRAAINLGTQFGLSLYSNGATRDVVGAVLAGGFHDEMGEIVEAPVSPTDGPDSVEGTETPTAPVEAGSDPEVAETWASRFREAMTNGDVPGVVALKTAMTAEGVADVVYNGKTLAKIADIAVVEAGKNAAKADLGATEVSA